MPNNTDFSTQQDIDNLLEQANDLASDNLYNDYKYDINTRVSTDNAKKAQSNDRLLREEDGSLIDDSSAMLTAKKYANDALSGLDWLAEAVGGNVDYRFKAEKDGKLYSMDNKDFDNESTLFDIQQEYKNTKEDPNARHVLYTMRKFNGIDENGNDKYIYKHGVDKVDAYNRYKTQPGAIGWELVDEKRIANAEHLENALHTTKQAFNNRVIDYGTNQDKQSGINFGSGKTEIYNTNLLDLNDEDVSREQALRNMELSKRKAEAFYKDREGKTDSLFKAVLAGGAGLAMDFGDGVLDILTPNGDNSLLNHTQEDIDKFVGYDRREANAAMTEAVASFKKGNYADAIIDNLYGGYLSVGESLPYMLAMSVGGEAKAITSGIKSLKQANDEVKAAYKAYDLVDNINDVAKAQQIVNNAVKKRDLVLSSIDGITPTKAKYIKDMADRSLFTNQLVNTAKSTGLHGTTIATTNSIITDRINEGDTDISVAEALAIYSSQFVSNALDKFSFDTIVKSDKIKDSIKKAFTTTNKDGRDNILLKLSKDTLGVASSMGEEAVQEYLQTWSEILGKQLGVNDKGLLEVINDEDNQDEALGASLMGAIGGGTMHTGSSAISTSVNVANKVYKNTNSTVKDNSDITTKYDLIKLSEAVNTTPDGKGTVDTKTKLYQAISSHYDPNSDYTLDELSDDDIDTIVNNVSKGNDELKQAWKDNITAMKISADKEVPNDSVNENVVSNIASDAMNEAYDLYSKGSTVSSSTSTDIEDKILDDYTVNDNTNVKNPLFNTLDTLISKYKSTRKLLVDKGVDTKELDDALQTLELYNTNKDYDFSSKKGKDVNNEVSTLGFIGEDGIVRPSIKSYSKLLPNNIIANKEEGFGTEDQFVGFADRRLKELNDDNKQIYGKLVHTKIIENKALLDIATKATELLTQQVGSADPRTIQMSIAKSNLEEAINILSNRANTKNSGTNKSNVNVVKPMTEQTSDSSTVSTNQEYNKTNNKITSSTPQVNVEVKQNNDNTSTTNGSKVKPVVKENNITKTIPNSKVIPSKKKDELYNELKHLKGSNSGKVILNNLLDTINSISSDKSPINFKIVYKSDDNTPPVSFSKKGVVVLNIDKLVDNEFTFNNISNATIHAISDKYLEDTSTKEFKILERTKNNAINSGVYNEIDNLLDSTYVVDDMSTKEHKEVQINRVKAFLSEALSNRQLMSNLSNIASVTSHNESMLDTVRKVFKSIWKTITKGKIENSAMTDVMKSFMSMNGLLDTKQVTNDKYIDSTLAEEFVNVTNLKDSINEQGVIKLSPEHKVTFNLIKERIINMLKKEELKLLRLKSKKEHTPKEFSNKLNKVKALISTKSKQIVDLNGFIKSIDLYLDKGKVPTVSKDKVNKLTSLILDDIDSDIEDLLITMPKKDIISSISELSKNAFSNLSVRKIHNKQLAKRLELLKRGIDFEASKVTKAVSKKNKEILYLQRRIQILDKKKTKDRLNKQLKDTITYSLKLKNKRESIDLKLVKLRGEIDSGKYGIEFMNGKQKEHLFKKVTSLVDSLNKTDERIKEINNQKKVIQDKIDAYDRGEIVNYYNKLIKKFKIKLNTAKVQLKKLQTINSFNNEDKDTIGSMIDTLSNNDATKEDYKIIRNEVKGTIKEDSSNDLADKYPSLFKARKSKLNAIKDDILRGNSESKQLKQYISDGYVKRTILDSIGNLGKLNKIIPSIRVIKTNNVKTTITEDGKLITEDINGGYDLFEVLATKVNEVNVNGRVAFEYKLPDDLIRGIRFGIMTTLGSFSSVSGNLLSKSDADLIQDGIPADDVQSYRNQLLSGTVPEVVLMAEVKDAVLDYMGVTFNKEADYKVKEAFTKSLTSHILQQLKVNEFISTEKLDYVSTGKSMNFVRINHNKLQGINLSDISKAISELGFITDNKDRQAPSTKPYKVQKTIVNSDGIEVTKERAKYLKKNNETPYRISDDVYYIKDLIDKHGRDKALEVLGVKPLSEGKTIFERRTIHAVNDKIKRELDYLLYSYDLFKDANGDILDIYLPFADTKSGRTTIRSSLNMQESKLHREFVHSSSMKKNIVFNEDTKRELVDIKPDDVTNIEMFELYMSQALDLDPDKNSLLTVLHDIRSKIDVYDPTGVKVLDKNLKWLKSFIEAKEMDLSLLGGNAYSAGGYHTIRMAIELRKIHLAKLRGEDNIYTVLTGEADAITSGVVLQMLQIASDDMLKLASKGGVYTKDEFTKWSVYTKHILGIKYKEEYGIEGYDVPFSASALIEAGAYHINKLDSKYLTINGIVIDKPFLDIYTTVGESVLLMLPNVIKNINGKEEDMTSQDRLALSVADELNIDSLHKVRKISKPPTMVYSYGASSGGIMNKIALSTVFEVFNTNNSLFNRLIKLSADITEKDTQVKQIEKIAKIWDDVGNYLIYDEKEDLFRKPTQEELSNIPKDQRQYYFNIEANYKVKSNAIKISNMLLGDSYASSFSKLFKDIDNTRTTIKSIDLLVSNIFNINFKERVDEIKKNNNGKLSIEDLGNIVVGMQKEGIGHSLDIGDSVQPLYKKDKAYSRDIGQVSVKLFSTNDEHTGTSSNMQLLEFVDNTGASATIPIHAIDGEVIARAIKDDDFGSIYDAIIFGADNNDMSSGSSRYQQATIDVSLERSNANNYLQKLSKMMDYVSVDQLHSMLTPFKQKVGAVSNTHSIKGKLVSINFKGSSMNNSIKKIEYNKRTNVNLAKSIVYDNGSFKIDYYQTNSKTGYKYLKESVEAFKNSDGIYNITMVVDSYISNKRALDNIKKRGKTASHNTLNINNVDLSGIDLYSNNAPKDVLDRIVKVGKATTRVTMIKEVRNNNNSLKPVINSDTDNNSGIGVKGNEDAITKTLRYLELSSFSITSILKDNLPKLYKNRKDNYKSDSGIRVNHLGFPTVIPSKVNINTNLNKDVDPDKLLPNIVSKLEVVNDMILQDAKEYFSKSDPNIANDIMEVKSITDLVRIIDIDVLERTGMFIPLDLDLTNTTERINEYNIISSFITDITKGC